MATKMACPSGYKLVNGKCVDANGNVISLPPVPKSNKFATIGSLTSDCNKNPNSPECKKPEQKSKIKGLMLPGGKMQKLGGTTKMKMGGAKKPKMMSGSAKPKAMYGKTMKPGMMKKGGTKK